MKKILKLICTSLIIFAFNGCELDSGYPYDKEISTEQVNINNFLNASKLDMTELESGLYYMTVEEGSGKSPLHGDFVLYEYNMRLLDSTLIFTTDSALAAINNIYDTLKLYGTDKRKLGRMTQGENEALTLMKENGKSTIIVPFDLGFGEYSKLEKIPPYSTLIIDLYLKEVIKDPVAHEQKLLDNYILNNPGHEKLTDGIYYKQTNEGNEKIAAINSVIDIFYTMDLIDGRHISSEKTSINNGEISGINGLNYGISLMKEKEKGVFIIRSEWAFGDNENLLIPPYSTIIVDLEILKIH